MEYSLEEMLDVETIGPVPSWLQQRKRELAALRRDSARLDFLEQQNGLARYTGKCVFRLSMNRRGWRLHETTRLKGVVSVRQAIDNGMVALREDCRRE